MKEYTQPELEMIELDTADVIRTSTSVAGIETTPKGDYDGIWDLNQD